MKYCVNIVVFSDSGKRLQGLDPLGEEEEEDDSDVGYCFYILFHFIAFRQQILVKNKAKQNKNILQAQTFQI